MSPPPPHNVGNENPKSGRAAASVLTASGVLLGVLVAAPLALATARYLPSSVRWGGLPSSWVTQWSLHPLLLLDVLLPSPFGDVTRLGSGSFWGVGLVDNGHALYPGLYVGGLALALAIGGAVTRRRRTDALVAWFAIALLLALGRFTPLYSTLLHVPGLSTSRYPTKWLLGGMFPLALLASSGASTLASETTTDRRRAQLAVRILLAVLSLLALLCIGAWAGLGRWIAAVAGPSVSDRGVGSTLDPFVRLARSGILRGAARTGVPLALGLVAAFAVSRGGRTRKSVAAGTLGWIIALLVTADLLANTPRFAPTVPPQFYREVPRAARAVLDDGRGHLRLWVEPPDPRRPMRFRTQLSERSELFRWEREALLHETPISYGLDLAFAPDAEALCPAHYAELGIVVESAPLREKLMILGAAGVTHVASFRTLEDPRLTPLAEIDVGTKQPMRIWRNALAVPRARMVSRLIPYRGRDGYLDALARAPVDLFSRAAMADEEDALVQAAIATQDTNGAASERDSANASAPPRSVVLIADRVSSLAFRTSGAGGFLVLSDTFAPGWRATLDGRSVPLLRADFAFRAVAVPPREHEVVMHYNPWRS